MIHFCSVPHNTHNVILGMIGTLVVLFFVHRRQRDDEREKRLQYWREQVKKKRFFSFPQTSALTHFHTCRTLSAKTSSKCMKQPRRLYSSTQAHPAVRLYLASQRRTLRPQCCSIMGTQPLVYVNTPARMGHTRVGMTNSWSCVPPICTTTRSEPGGWFLYRIHYPASQYRSRSPAQIYGGGM